MKRILAVTGTVTGLLSVWIVIAGLPQTERPEIPSLGPELRISHADFAALIDALSEPEGYFDTDNFITNETSYLHVVDRLRSQVAPGGVYFGVGPDQNFSYIVHSQPSLAIVADIRRQNMLQHLLFKVLIEHADGRVDYLCSLLGRDCQDVPRSTGFRDLLTSIRQSPASPRQLQETIDDVSHTLVDEYGIRLTSEDLGKIEYVQRSFAESGLGLRFSSFGRSPSGYPSFEEILLEQDLDGQFESYVSSDALFERLQDFQRENRLIPVVGDFAGSRSLRSVAEFLSQQRLAVSVFYASNVEFYLFGSPSWNAYLENIRRFQFTDDAVFIRSYFPTGWPIHPQNVMGHRPTTLIQDAGGFLDDASNRDGWTYWDVVTRHLR